MAGAAGTHMQVAALRGLATGLAIGGQCCEHRLDLPHGIVIAADHQAIPALETKYATAVPASR